MRDDITAWARLGLVHHMLYPGCAENEAYHAETLLEMLARGDIETLDCFVPFDSALRATVIKAARASGKEIVAAAHLSTMRILKPMSSLFGERWTARTFMADQVACAAAMGATGFVFISGPGGDDPDAALVEFGSYCRWFCGELGRHGITALLEPFDTDVDKCFLFGPTEMCIEFIDSLTADVSNLAINLDLAHLPLMHETSAHAVAVTAPHIGRVHIGNCVLRDTASPWYGDKHPPVGLPGGEIDIPEVSEFLGLLIEHGFLNRDKRGAVVLEMQPYPGTTAAETIARSMAILREAWTQV